MGDLLIGDGIHALSQMPPESVDAIYADPPFGTGRDFGDYDDPAGPAWTTMLTRLLRSAWDALTPAGSLWLHLDPRAARAAHTLATTTLGTCAVRAEIIWERAGTKSSQLGIATTHDVILLIAKPTFRARTLPREHHHDRFLHDPDASGTPWSTSDLSAPGGRDYPHLTYAIQSPFTTRLHYPRAGRHWSFNAQTTLEHLNGWAPYQLVDIDDHAHRRALIGPTAPPQLHAVMLSAPDTAPAEARTRLTRTDWPTIIFGTTGAGGPRIKRPRPTGITPGSVWTGLGSPRTAKAELMDAVPNHPPFATPKPEALLVRVLTLATDPGQLVVDPFAGSGTTAAVAHKMGRRWVTCESSHQTATSITLPRLRHACAGHAPLTTATPATPPPHKVSTTDLRRAAAVIRALHHDRGTGLDDTHLDVVTQSLRAAAQTTTTTHTVPAEQVHVAPVPSDEINVKEAS